MFKDNENKYRNTITIMLIMMVLMTALMMVGTASAHSVEPAEGAGTNSDPYQVTNWHELAYANQSLFSDYKLQNNLTSSTDGYAEHISDPSGGWQPIGSDYDNRFQGSIDGNGYVIKDLVIDRPSTYNVGLIGYSEGNVSNLGLSNVDVRGGDYVGGLSGVQNSELISNVYISGTVSGGNYTGGIVGDVTSLVTTSYSIADVSGNNNVGGIAGGASNSMVRLSYFGATVSGNTNVDAIDGSAGGSILGTYYDQDLSSSSTVATGLTTSEMKGDEASDNMADFNFTGDWQTVDAANDADATADGYPILQSLDRQQQLSVQGISTQTTSSYDLTVNTYLNDTGDAYNVDYSITDSSGTEVASGFGNSVTETLEEGDYTISVSGDTIQNETRTITLSSDTIEEFTLDYVQYDLTIESVDDTGSALDTDYTITDASDGSTVASGQTGSDGTVTQTLDYGDYEVTLADGDANYETTSETVILDAAKTSTQTVYESSYNLTIESLDGDGNSVDTNYSITNSSGSTISSGNTGSDGTVTQTLGYDDYTITLADDDNDYQTNTTTVTLDSDTTVSQNLVDQTYDLSIESLDHGTGDYAIVDYTVTDSNGSQISTGYTESNPIIISDLDEDDYTIEFAQDNAMYKTESTTVTLDSDTTVSQNLSRELYEATIQAYDEYEQVSTHYIIEDQDGNVVLEGNTSESQNVTESLNAGTYTIKYASDDDQLYSKQETFTIDSDQTVTTTTDRIGLSLRADKQFIFTGEDVKFNADVSSRDDSNFEFDWYLNNESVATDHGDSYNYTFNESGEYDIRVETEIDGQRYSATRPLPNQTWKQVTDDQVENNSDVDDGDLVIEFANLTVTTVDTDGNPILATHYVDGNTMSDLVGDEIKESEINGTKEIAKKKGKSTDWQIIATHASYVYAQHPEYDSKYITIYESEIVNTRAYETINISVTLHGPSDSDKFVESKERPDYWGEEFVYNATIIDTDADRDLGLGDGGILRSIFGNVAGVLTASLPITVFGVGSLLAIPAIGFLLWIYYASQPFRILRRVRKIFSNGLSSITDLFNF